MKKIRIIFMLAFIINIATGLFIWNSERTKAKEIQQERKVLANEINQLWDKGESEAAKAKLNEMESLTYNEYLLEKSSMLRYIWYVMGFLVVLYIYIRIKIVGPFIKLNKFAENISRGDFDVPLDYSRDDYFGEFTWAFDNMRAEIVKARRGEKEAIENNKTVIAALSHDIKTPVASLCAYTEGLEANMDSTPEKRDRYIRTIRNKCDDITRLTNDLVAHSLSDLDRLSVECLSVDICSLLKEQTDQLVCDGSLKLSIPEGQIMVRADAKRMAQIFENIISNGRKYAETDIDVKLLEGKDHVDISFRDYGPGIPDEDLPFVCDKFYRGHNKGDKPGSGLGFFIVDYLVKKQDGELLIRNAVPGLEVRITLKKI